MTEPTSLKSPFKFLDSYIKDDRAIFFGRDVEIEELYERIFESNLLVLYGATGTGKTSLINCGLAGQLDDRDWLPIQIRREGDLLKSLNKKLNLAAEKPLKDGATLKQMIRSLYLDFYKPVYLIFDQFEELFISGTQAEQIEFFERIHSVLDADLSCKILISIRGDYLDQLSKYELVIPQLLENRMYLERMSRQQLFQVIERTTQHFGIELTEKMEVLQEMVKQLGNTRGGVELVNLQIYLDKLYRNDLKRRGNEDRPIQFDKALLRDTRSLEDVLGSFLEEQLLTVDGELSRLGNVQKNVPLSVLLTLVTESGTKKPLDDQVVVEQLKKRKNIKPALTRHCIDRFQKLRIIRSSNEV